MKEIKLLDSCPGAMQERAIWARKMAMVDPSLVQVDDEMLPWTYHEDHNKWYSFNGNYSSTSPEDKLKNAISSQERLRNVNEQQAVKWIEEYHRLEYWSKIRAKVLKRDKHTCQICGASAPTKLHIHHVLKRVKGGTDHFDNLITVCPKCHATADRGGYDPTWR